MHNREVGGASPYSLWVKGHEETARSKLDTEVTSSKHLSCCFSQGNRLCGTFLCMALDGFHIPCVAVVRGRHA